MFSRMLNVWLTSSSTPHFRWVPVQIPHHRLLLKQPVLSPPRFLLQVSRLLLAPFHRKRRQVSTCLHNLQRAKQLQSELRHRQFVCVFLVLFLCTSLVSCVFFCFLYFLCFRLRGNNKSNRKNTQNQRNHRCNKNKNN